MVFHPLQVDGDVAFHEMKFRVPEQRPDPLGLQIHAVNMPVGVSQYVLAQVMPDESIDAENENVFQDEPLPTIIFAFPAPCPRPKRHGLMRQGGRRLGGRRRLTIHRELHHPQAPPIDAVGIPPAVLGIQTRRQRGVARRMRIHPRFEDCKPTPVYLGKGTRKGRRDGPHQIVNFARRAAPVDASILGSAPAEVGSLRQIERAWPWRCRPPIAAGCAAASAGRHRPPSSIRRAPCHFPGWARPLDPPEHRHRASPPCSAGWRRSRARP